MSQSPYVAKLYAYWITVNYRGYNIFAANGILFNHESPMEEKLLLLKRLYKVLSKYRKTARLFIFRKFNASRDWGQQDYVEGMWMISTKNLRILFCNRKTYTVRYFVEKAFSQLNIKILWKGQNLKEYGIDKNTGKIIVRINPKYFRPTEVDFLKGDASKAKKKLGWQPKTSFSDLVKEMVEHEVELLK